MTIQCQQVKRYTRFLPLIFSLGAKIIDRPKRTGAGWFKEIVTDMVEKELLLYKSDTDKTAGF